MKVINNRYKVDENLYNDFFVEAYRVEDLLMSNNQKYLKIYHYNLQKDLIEYFITNKRKIQNIKHNNILQTQEFDMIKTIDAHEISSLMYYTVSEAIAFTTIYENMDMLDFYDRLNVLLEIILAISFLHFRGFTYKFLNPQQIALLDNKSIKLQNVSTIIEKTYNNEYNEFERGFLSPDFISQNKEKERDLDYYSLARMIEYLFLNNEQNLPIKEENISFFNHVITNLEDDNFEKTDSNLVKLVNEIIEFFNLDFKYDLIEERDHLFFDNQIIGRDKEITRILEFDATMSKQREHTNLIVVSGEKGTGKTRFLKEIVYRLKLRNRTLYSIDVKMKSKDGTLNIADLLRQLINEAPGYLKEKYSNEFSVILPELRIASNQQISVDITGKNRKYRLGNRITNFLKELSADKTIYLLFDNIENGSDDFLDLMDYLVNNLLHSNIVFLFGIDCDELRNNQNGQLRIDRWKEDFQPLDVQLNRLDLKEIGELIKNILGMGYVNAEFSSILFKESDGKPKRIEELVSYLYNEGQLYINEKGKWALDIDDYSDIYIPTNIDIRMVQQLREIPEVQYEVLKIMSVFSGMVPFSILTKMLDLGGAPQSVLNDLVTYNFVEAKQMDVDKEYSYGISNNELNKLVSSQIEQKKKIEIHEKAAIEIEKLESHLSEDLFEERVYHLVQSQQNEKAISIILQKVKVLQNKSGNDANYLLEKAYNILAIDGDSIPKLEILAELIYISLLKSELKDNDVRLSEYIVLANRLNSKYHILNYKRIQIELHFLRGRQELFLQQIDELKLINEVENIEEFRVYCLTVMTNSYLVSGEYEKAEIDLNEALRLAIKFNLTDQLGNIYNLLGIIKYLSGDNAQATVYYRKSYDCFRADRDIMRSVKPINNLGNIYITHLNDIEKAIEYYRRGLELSKQHGLKKMQMVFSINLSETSKINYEYEKALEFILEGNRIAVELQDSHKIAICQNLLGSIYLKKEEYDKAYNCYTYAMSMFSADKSKDLELASAHYNFLGEFFTCFGAWDQAMEYNEKAKEMYAKIDMSEFYRFRFKMILVEFLRDRKFNKDKLDQFIQEYKSTVYVEDFRKVVLIIALLGLSIVDVESATKYLEHDKSVQSKANFDFLNKLRSMVMFPVNIDDANREQMIVKLEKDLMNEFLPFRTIILTNVATGFERQNKHKEAMKYYIEALECIYRSVKKIPRWDLKIGYMKCRDTDMIKDKINHLFDKYYGFTIDQKRIEILEKEESLDTLDRYFGFTKVIEAIGKDEFYEISNVQGYEEVLGTEDIPSLMSKLNNNNDYNLNLILTYLSKEAFATEAFIIKYNSDTEEYEVITSLHSAPTIRANINDGILKLATRTKNGLLVGSDHDSSIKKVYRNLLTKSTTGVICVPIDVRKFTPESWNKRGNNENGLEYISGYIYLETNKVFNNFNEEMLNLINNTLYLVHMNLEMIKLRVIGSTDKLTGAFTRKYYEVKFNELFSNRKAVGKVFAVLMLDLDTFKAINDTYGHGKGDEVLREIGLIIKSNVRSTDIFGRYGGEEFVVILKDAGENEAQIIGEKIRKHVEQLKIKGIKNPITLSIGISLFPNHSKFKEDLIEKADQALYHSKQTGKNKVSLWNHEMDNVFDKVDKLAGILTGNNEIDNKNILGLVQTVHLIEEEIDLKEKIYRYLGELSSILDSETATIIILNENGKQYYTRSNSNVNFTETPTLNEDIVKRVIQNKKGEYLIDWENLDDVEPITGIPNWKSILVVPMIKNGEVRGLTYLSTPLNQKEFDLNALNLLKNIAGIFTSLL